MLSTERAAGCVLLPDPLCRRAPWPNIPRCPPGRGNSALLSAQHQCQASQTLLCSLNPSQQNQRSVSRTLLESGICPAVPGCSGCQEQHPQADLNQGQPARVGQGCLPHIGAHQKPVGDKCSPVPAVPAHPRSLCCAGELCSQHSSLCRCPTSPGLSSVPLESQQGAELPFLCKVCDFGGATRAMCQKGSFSGTSHKVQRPSQRPDHPLQTNHSGISPGFQFRHCWDPLLHSVTLGGWHCDRPGVPGIPSLHRRC